MKKYIIKIFNRFIPLLLSFTLSTTCIAFSTDYSYAEHRKDDYIVNGTLYERGIKPADCPDLTCDSALLVKETGETLFLRNDKKEMKIASLTKIFTCYTALKYGDLTSKIQVSAKAASVSGSSANLKSGDELTLEDACYAMMLPSGNDAACAIAENIGKRIANTNNDDAGYNAFIDKTNEEVANLGCQNTKLTNPHGLDEDEFESDSHSCAYDISKIVVEAFKNDKFSEIVKSSSYDLKITRGGDLVTSTVKTTDSLLDNYEGACGIKTGTTGLAGSCFAGAFYRNNEYIFSIVLNSNSDASRYSDTTALTDWYYNGIIDYKIDNTDDGTMCYVSNSTWLDKTFKAGIKNREETISLFKYKGNVSQTFEYYDNNSSIKYGDVVGKINLFQDNKLIKSEELIALEDSNTPGIFENIGICITRFLHIFTGEKNVADSISNNPLPKVIEFI